MTTDISTENRKGFRNSLWVGILLVVLGIAGIIVPNISTFVVETWISLLLVSAGAAKLSYAFGTRGQGGFAWKIVLGGLYIATGVMLLIYPLTGVLTLTLLLGTFFLTEGAFELVLAFRLRGRPNWTWVLINAIVTLVLGAMVWLGWPFNAPWLLGTLVGVSVLFTGISRTMLSLNPSAGSLNPSDQITPV